MKEVMWTGLQIEFLKKKYITPDRDLKTDFSKY